MKLPQKMSEALTNTMIEANIIKKEEHDIYSYCYEFLFENLLTGHDPISNFCRRSACSRIRSVCCSFLSELFYYDAFL